MNAKNLAIREKEMREIWDSFEPCFRSDLERLDFRARAMIREMQTLGVPLNMIYDFIPKAFARLWDEVAREGVEKYERRKTTA